ncbi:hypothetical protein MUCCIDRAFT_112771 [Mucor lusitanicus CBS 277.49]|uniref:Uncharacterized protein n=1 Tax=Mucor lusitanicus CBS 277.49 TaxID=747725 RepID=A0A162QQ97_MUCCL|nr:hypothetical protein MUCCIDRAFT_112771 [Mucor lusitanicus CBS 277.49]
MSEGEYKNYLKTDDQMVRFINKVFTVTNGGVPELYDSCALNLKQVFDVVVQYSHIFDDGSIYAFNSWRLKQQRVVVINSYIETSGFVLKKQYQVEAAKEVIEEANYK